MTRGFLGLGSNIGDRRAHLEEAVAALPAHGVDVVASSSVYETEPVGLVLDQREFYNACLCVETGHGPDQLLAACKDVERELGRPASGVRHGPRPIDVDVLLLDELEYSSDRLTLPHPEVSSRRFVIVPLLELDPDLALPGGPRLSEALAALVGDGQEVRRVGGPLV
jgi:2-amino-4-hydroxy-6-hydroxymethyldihydropteridine diphosphokinase